MNCLGVQASPGPTVISSFIYCLSNTVGGSKKEYKKYSISKRLKNTEKNKEISEFQIQIEVWILKYLVSHYQVLYRNGLNRQ